MRWPVNPLRGETINRRAVCGRSARTVRREGGPKSISPPYPYQDLPPGGPDSGSNQPLQLEGAGRDSLGDGSGFGFLNFVQCTLTLALVGEILQNQGRQAEPLGSRQRSDGSAQKLDGRDSCKHPTSEKAGVAIGFSGQSQVDKMVGPVTHAIVGYSGRA